MNRAEWWEEAAAFPRGRPRPLAAGSRAVVTGCAGFIGSHLCETLLALGCEVMGVDSLTEYYDPDLKRRNLAVCSQHPRFVFREEDLLALPAAELLTGADVCFHLAAQAGVRASWGRHFDEYLAWNVQATQKLLEGCLAPPVRERLQRFVYSSSSSVYGDQGRLPVSEDALPAPRSPYGVTKLAAEHLCVLYAANLGVPTVSLRYFTVYGPRQRPDMAFRKFLDRALRGETFNVYGDGSQTRDFTYVEDAVRANLLAAGCPEAGAVFNVGGGERVALRDALSRLQALLAEAGRSAPAIAYEEVARGDVRDTFADRGKVEAALGYRPFVSFDEGLARMVAWRLDEGEA
jgi:nucleoside-diphosphate-sugar epimerase